MYWRVIYSVWIQRTFYHSLQDHTVGLEAVLQNIGRVNLLLLKDDKDGRVSRVIHAAVIKSVRIASTSAWRATILRLPLHKVSNKHLSYEHAVAPKATGAVLMGIAGISGKVAS